MCFMPYTIVHVLFHSRRFFMKPCTSRRSLKNEFLFMYLLISWSIRSKIEIRRFSHQFQPVFVQYVRVGYAHFEKAKAYILICRNHANHVFEPLDFCYQREIIKRFLCFKNVAVLSRCNTETTSQILTSQLHRFLADLNHCEK